MVCGKVKSLDVDEAVLVIQTIKIRKPQQLVEAYR